MRSPRLAQLLSVGEVLHRHRGVGWLFYSFVATCSRALSAARVRFTKFTCILRRVRFTKLSLEATNARDEATHGP